MARAQAPYSSGVIGGDGASWYGTTISRPARSFRLTQAAVLPQKAQPPSQSSQERSSSGTGRQQDFHLARRAAQRLEAVGHGLLERHDAGHQRADIQPAGREQPQ